MVTHVLTLPFLVQARLARHSIFREVLLVVGASVLLALSAQVAIPWQPVPMTLQPLAVLLVGLTLGSRRGAAAVLLYLVEGACGLPVFALGRAGVAVLVGPTAGYLYAFPLAAWIAGRASERAWGRSLALSLGAMGAAVAVVHLGGWSWLAAVAGLGAERAFATGVAPFLLGDLVKIAVAATALPAVQRSVDRRRS